MFMYFLHKLKSSKNIRRMAPYILIHYIVFYIASKLSIV